MLGCARVRLRAACRESRRVGKSLLAEMAGLWSARRIEYHVIYEIGDDTRVVLIHRAAHRRSVYM